MSNVQVDVEEMIERIDDAFFALDDEWRFAYLNGQAAELLDIDREAIVGEVIWDEFESAVGTKFQTEYERAMETQEPVEFEEHYPPLETWFEVSAYPSKTGLSVYFRDITDRRDREQQLQQYESIVETVEDGVYALDSDEQFILVNDAFCEMTGYDRSELLGEHVTTVKAEWVVERANQLVSEVASGNREEGAIEFDLYPRGGPPIPVESRMKPLSLDERVGRCGVVRDISERRERERELRHRVEQQEIVTRLGKQALGTPSIDTLMAEATRLVAEALESDYCKVLELDADREELVLRQGVGWRDGIVGTETVSAVADGSQAAYTLSANEPIVVEDLETEARFSGPDLLTSHDVTSGISTIIGPDDDPWGILGVHDTEERTFTEQDVNFVQSVANVLGSAIRRHQDEQELRARHERLAALNDINSLVHSLSESLFELSSRPNIEELVCDRLAAAESYEFAWIGEAADSEMVVNTEAGVEDYLSNLRLAVDEDPGKQGPTVQAHQTGEMQVVQNVREDPRYESWRAHAREYGFRASAAVPIIDGGKQYGTLNVYSSRDDAFSEEEREALDRLGSIVAYAIRAVERDRKLQRERDRIEFMNRLLRHNLLNSLNVVKARLDLLEGQVDYEVSDHLETATGRTAEMIDFVETVREVTKVIGHSDQQELEPVDLGEALATHVARADTAHPAAEFHLEQPPSIEIVADDLLDEVLDNVLRNAVQHNDTDSPTVWVETTVTDDEVVVAVADDGPGIPEDLQERILERDARSFENPGTGFGLYLVDEIVDSYGGTIEVTDSEAGGAKFEITFQRASPAD